MLRVLFVCTGNICRSPTAHGLARRHARQYGLENRFFFDSAALYGSHCGDAPDPRTQSTARRYGVDLSDLRARTVQGGDYHDFDLILAMDSGHYDLLHARAPQPSGAQIALYLDYVSKGHPKDVPDPYYGNQQDFNNVFALLQETMPALFCRLEKEKRQA